MASPRLTVLEDSELREIHEGALRILSGTGILAREPGILEQLKEAGAAADASNKERVYLSELLIARSVQRAGKQYVLHGRDPRKIARFGHGDLLLMSSPGQMGWFDWQTGQPRPATFQDTRDAIALGDALSHVNIVGALAQPADIPEPFREIWIAAELIKGATKPTRSWVTNRKTATWVLDLYRSVAGGAAALRERPMVEGFLTPVSPLQFPCDGLEVFREFVLAGQPACIASMPMAGGTAPVTLAGAMALAHAEILAGIVIAQVLSPGIPVLYGGIPHILDPRTMVCSFGSPEQALMAAGMAQLGRSLKLPVYVNAGLTDSKLLDAQAGMEKAATLLAAASAGADLVGHGGICGSDHGGNLQWLCADNELMAYVKRITRGFDVSPETLGDELIRTVQPGGSFLAEEHTVRHMRRELWTPNAAWTRKSYDVWAQGRTDFAGRLDAPPILSSHHPVSINPDLAKEIDAMVERARTEFPL